MEPFGKEHAEIYDDQFAAMSPLRDMLQLIASLGLAGLPESADILCAGAGTGSEVLRLARDNPGWRFHLVDPAPAMLDVAQTRLVEAGIADRCRLHVGFVSSLDTARVYDGATSLLVSHFLTSQPERTDFFHQIAIRLKTGAPFVNADLAADRNDRSFDQLMDVWLTGLQRSSMADEQRRSYRQSFGTAFAAHAPAEVEQMMVSGGFAAPVQVFQGMLVRGWVTSRTAD